MLYGLAAGVFLGLQILLLLLMPLCADRQADNLLFLYLFRVPRFAHGNSAFFEIRQNG